MAALDASFLTDPWPDQVVDPDIAKCERDLERLRYAEWKTEEQRLEIQRCIDANVRHLERMRRAAA